jgi:hypothetical protein
MTRIANPFRYMYREPQPNQTGAIYKAWFGKRYLIWKAKSLAQSVNTMAMDLDRKLRLGIRDGDAFEKVVAAIRRGRIGIFEVEVILASDNPVDLLKTEYDELKKCMGDNHCLNINFYPNISSWISESAREEFEAYVEKLKADKKKQGKRARKSKKQGKASPNKKATKSPKIKPKAKPSVNGTRKSKKA